MIIQIPELIENANGTVRIQSPIQTREGKRVLWYELDSKYKDYLTVDRLDAFVVGLILYAMQTNEEIVVDGPISNKLARNLKYYMHIMKMFYPEWHVVPLQTPILDPLNQCPRGQAVGSSFTTGIDSYCTLWDNFKNSESDCNRITHLFNIHTGQKGCQNLDGRVLFRKRLQSISEAAKQMNLELVVIDSNQETFYGFDGNSETHGPRFISGALLLQKLFSIFYFPSSDQYSDFIPYGSTPLADPLLSTEVLDIVHDGAQYSRIEKTKMISDWDITQSFMTVCHGNYEEGKTNCSNCEKCVRTMVILDMLGVRKQYEKVFDFTDFENKKDLYICNRFLNGLVVKKFEQNIWWQIKNHAKERGYPLKVKPLKLLVALWIFLKRPSGIKKLLLRLGFK